MKFLALSIFLLFLSIVPPKAGAACWCADPIADNCQCGRTGISDYSYNYNYTVSAGRAGSVTKTIKLFCDTAEEARSEFAVKAPICGSSPEILPYCAYGIDGNKNFWVCYGANFAKGVTNLPIPPIKGQVETEKMGAFTFNGQQFGSAGINVVKICSDGVFCCGSGNSCSQNDIPDEPSYCTPQRTGVANPQFCGKNEIGSGESRLFFPHLRNISALSTLLQTIFNPGPSLFKRNVEPVPAGKTASSGLDSTDTVTSKIYFHQGKDDATQIVNDSDNNSSLRVNQPAPAPLYNFDGSDNPYKTSGFCNINDTKVNPGDDLLGPTIVSNLTYTQKYQYKVAPSLGCFGDNATVSEDERKKCCSFKASGNKRKKVLANCSDLLSMIALGQKLLLSEVALDSKDIMQLPLTIVSIRSRGMVWEELIPSS